MFTLPLVATTRHLSMQKGARIKMKSIDFSSGANEMKTGKQKAEAERNGDVTRKSQREWKA